MANKNSEDTISRAAAIDALRKMQTYKMFSGDDMLLIDQAGAQTELMLLPPAEPKRIRGKWIDTRGNTEWYAREYECSECGGTMLGESNFCPNCGAKMEVTE